MANSGLRVVGRDHPIADAALKVTGGLVYGMDMQLPDMLHAKLLLSPVAHARITTIDASKAEALPGVVAVFSHLNAPAKAYSRYRIFRGQVSVPRGRDAVRLRRPGSSATAWPRSWPWTRRSRRTPYASSTSSTRSCPPS